MRKYKSDLKQALTGDHAWTCRWYAYEDGHVYSGWGEGATPDQATARARLASRDPQYASDADTKAQAAQPYS